VSAEPRSPRQAGSTRLAAAPKPKSNAGDNTPAYPGQRFGLPERGPGSVAPMGRRLLALLLDWILCEVIVAAVTHHSLASGGTDFVAWRSTENWTIVAFALEVYLLTAVSGLTIGKRLLGMRVIRTNGERPGFGWALLRTILLLCVVPPLLSDRDLRGLHDRAADTIVVRL